MITKCHGFPTLPAHARVILTSSCANRFNQRSQLTVHMRVILTSSCPNRFNQRSQLTVHMRMILTSFLSQQVQPALTADGPYARAHGGAPILLQDLQPCLLPLHRAQAPPQDAHRWVHYRYRDSQWERIMDQITKKTPKPLMSSLLVFNRVHRLEIQSGSLVFWTPLVNHLTGSPSPRRGGGLRQKNTCC
jgi:hypothetical protein